jgi:transcription antitermination protein NusB
MASRHKGRILSLLAIYQREIANTTEDDLLSFKWYEKGISIEEKDLASTIIIGVLKNWETIDKIIKTYIRNRAFDQVSVINRCILRLSIYCLINMKEIPARITINEAIELTREYESEESVSFINGILDSIYKDNVLNTVEEE